ncbi:MAG: leucine-rich repeat domain-containing protein, partial [Clostridia bacterium]|nr:leucine-rich repeat domain-containing protein [Clostridia bacterium]
TNVLYCEGDTLTIPATIDGVPVVAIERLTKDIDIRAEEVTHTFHSNIKHVVVNANLRYLGDCAFYGMRNLETLNLSQSTNLEDICESAFTECVSLRQITFASGSDYSFADGCLIKDEELLFASNECESIPDNVDKIGDFVFFGREDMEISCIPARIRYIGMGAFAEMGSLASLTFESGILEIGSYAFYDCGITSVTLPSSLQTVGVHAFNVESLYAYGDLPFTESMEDTYGVGQYSQISGLYDWEDFDGWEIITDTDVETLSEGLAEYFGDTADAHILYYSTETIGDALSDIETGKYVIYLTNEEDIASLPEQSEELVYMVITPSGLQVLPENKGPVENILMGELIAMKSREVFGEEFWHSTAQALGAYPLFMLGEYANNYDIAMGVARNLNVDIIMFDSIEDNLDYFQMLDDTEFNTFIVISDSYVNLGDFGIENATGIQFFDEGPESMYNYGIFNLEYPVAYIVSDVLLWYEGNEPRPVLVPIENDCYYCVINISFDETAITYTSVMMTWDEYWEEYDKYYVAKGIKEEV